MQRGVKALAEGASTVAYEPTPPLAAAPDLHCRMCELETENARLRLLVGELLVANQKLREKAASARRNGQAA
jgi:hypothetical protein